MERRENMKKLKKKLIMILCCCLFLTGCSIDSEYLILKKSEILDTKRFDKELEKKMKKELENGLKKERYVKLENGQVYELFTELKEDQAYLEMILNITNDMETDQEWNIGNSSLFIPGSWEEFHSYYEIIYFSEHPPLVSKQSIKQYCTWTLEAKKNISSKIRILCR